MRPSPLRSADLPSISRKQNWLWDSPILSLLARRDNDHIASIQALNDRTVRIQLKGRYAPLVATFHVPNPIFPSAACRGRKISVYPSSMRGVVRSASISDFWSAWQ